MYSGFWEGGSETYEAALHEEYTVQLNELQKQLKQCDEDAERSTIKVRIKSTEAEYRTKLNDVDDLLF